MYDQNIGKHCTITTCKQKDWLPVNCKYCHQTFCSDHYSIESHHCESYQKQSKKVYTCPLCNMTLTLNPNLSVEENFSVHEAIDCQKDFQQNVKKVEVCEGKEGVRCHAKLTELNKVVCKYCRKVLCLKHRAPEEHGCPGFG